MTPIDFLLLALATWYVAHAVTRTHGPFHILERLRERVKLGGLTSCPVCLAPWAAAFLWLLWATPLQPVVAVLAVAGAALMLGSYSGANHTG